MNPYIIAEIGVNHNGSLEIAKKLIFEAYIAGADAVKFQTFNSKYVVSENTELAEYQKKNSLVKNQYELIKKLELSKNDFFELKKYSDAMGIEFISTPFDEESLKFLVEELKVRILKLSSCDLTNINLLWKAARYKLPLIISTGMSTMEDIKLALSIIIHSRNEEKYPIDLNECISKFTLYKSYMQSISNVTILQCTTSYPCPIESINLNAMLSIKKEFGLPVGYSDHSNGFEACLAATALGASILEKHFTLSNDMKGPDHKASMEPKLFIEMVKSVRKTKTSLGTFKKDINDAEKENCSIAKRSIYARKDIKKGEIISSKDLIALRPEREEAVSSKYFFNLIGIRSKTFIKSGDYIPKNLIKEN